MKEKKLNEIGLSYNSDKVSEHHNYLDLYEKHLEKIRFNNNQILEIGVLNGDSIKVFNEYFENSMITGVDINDRTFLNSDRIKILQGDQSDINFLETFVDEFYDVIIDDGSHRMDHQQITFGVLFKKLKKGGVYIIEDLHTSLPYYFETVVHGKHLFGLNEDNSNNTISFLESIKEGNPKSYYLSDDKLEYINKNIDSIDIVVTNDKDESKKSITSIIIKK